MIGSAEFIATHEHAKSQCHNTLSLLIVSAVNFHQSGGVILVILPSFLFIALDFRPHQSYAQLLAIFLPRALAPVRIRLPWD